MVPIAEIALYPGGIIAWLVVGLIAGYFAGSVMRGSGYGILGDILIGLIGAVLGGFVVSFFATGVMGFWGSVAVAFVSACVLIALARAISPARSMP
jgi:uncharacterized membrane protein YeaQ/YmgE (transglycosylase-associated protein family)